MTSAEEQTRMDQPTFWSGEGGERWTANIETVERQISGLSEILLDRAGAQPGEAVLDVGCGGGVTSEALAEQVGPAGRVLGIDVSAVILDVARQRYSGVSNLSFECGDAEHMPLPSKTFDLIVSRFGVMFFEDPIAAFRNLHAALRDNGRIVFMCWRTPQENPWMAVPTTAAFEVIGRPAPPDPEAPGPFAFGDPARVRRILEQSGFVNVHLEAIDEDVNLGSTEQAVKLMSEMGPAASLLREAAEEQRARAIDAVSQALRRHESAEGIRLPSGTWIVSATS